MNEGETEMSLQRNACELCPLITVVSVLVQVQLISVDKGNSSFLVKGQLGSDLANFFFF